MEQRWKAIQKPFKLQDLTFSIIQIAYKSLFMRLKCVRLKSEINTMNKKGIRLKSKCHLKLELDEINQLHVGIRPNKLKTDISHSNSIP